MLRACYRDRKLELLTCLSVKDRVSSSLFAAHTALSCMGVGVMEERETSA